MAQACSMGKLKMKAGNIMKIVENYASINNAAIRFIVVLNPLTLILGYPGKHQRIKGRPPHIKFLFQENNLFSIVSIFITKNQVVLIKCLR